ncbi:hypothetical protein QBC37DRAFT_391840 [Rhypophila decipiens]|uniref:Uncharacterized protein n=1 Tax=Rhypophila decipiens TaxID=261697 RepID=A0AAN6Y3H0_9PEZI|nr:hypothetical protein QBC37DRAFT_391840 [Rhypophila decipiens]
MTVVINDESASPSNSWQRSLLLPPNTDTRSCVIASLPLVANEPMAFARLFPLFHHTNWQNPRESIGDPIGRFQNGRYQCWHPKGRALETYILLAPELHEYIATCPKSGTVIVEMYMIGHREESAAPRVLVCSPEEKVRKTIRKMVKKSKILDRYPGFGLGDASSLPDRRVPSETAKEEIDKILPPDCDISRDKVVLIEGMEASAGKWIYTVNNDGRSLRAAATAGPFVFINETWCQLTVSHPFFPSQPWGIDKPEDPGTMDDDCDFEGMSDVDEEADLEATARASVSSFSIDEESFVDDWRSSPTEADTQDDSYIDGEENSDAETCDTASGSRPSTPGNSLPTTISDSVDETEESRTQHPPAAAQQRDLSLSRLQYLGKLGLASEEFEDSSKFDYALIVINNGQIPQLTAPQYINTQLVIAKSFPVVDMAEETSPWEKSVRMIGLESLDVVTLMPRAGPVSSRLIPSPAFVRMAGKTHFQKVYPLTLLDAAVSDGDSGSPVFDASGKFCGHIVSGSQGTSHAYIIPATDIMSDLESHVWGKVSLPNLASMRVSKPIGTADYFSRPLAPAPQRTRARAGPAAAQSPIATEPTNTLDSETMEDESTPRPNGNHPGPTEGEVLNDADTPTTRGYPDTNRGSLQTEIAEIKTCEAARETPTARAFLPSFPHDPDPREIGDSGIDLSLVGTTKGSDNPREQPRPILPAPPPHTRDKGNPANVVHAVPLEMRLVPPPHLRAKVAHNHNLIPPASITATLGQATLRLMNSLALSTTDQPLVPAGLTVVVAEEELCDDLVMSRNESDIVTSIQLSSSMLDGKRKRGRRTETLAKEWSALVLRSSLRQDAREKKQDRTRALNADAPAVEEPDNHHLLHPHIHSHGHGVRDKFRSMTTKMGRHSSPGRQRGEIQMGEAGFNQDLGVVE